MKLTAISVLAEAAGNVTFSAADLLQARVSLLLHAAGGLLLLLVIVTLAIYKPRGLTRYGTRNVCPADCMSTAPPRWWKVFRALVIGFVVFLVFMMIAGEHGPGMHISAG